MTNLKYLQKLLAAHSLAEDSTEIQELEAKREEVEKVLCATYKDPKPTITHGGSYAKGTMIVDSYDLDISVIFENDDTSAGETLEAIFDDVAKTLGKDYTVKKKRSALRLETAGDKADYTHVDVVPGRFTDTSKTDLFLHQNEGDKERLKTNIVVQIAHIRDSGRTDIIKLAKLWRSRTGLAIKTFVLELLVIEVLKGKTESALDTLLTRFLTEVRDNLDDYSIEDPANPTGNDLAPIYGDTEKELLRGAATQALELLESGDYSDVFGEEFSDDEETDEERNLAATVLWPALRLADALHRQAPTWPMKAPSSWKAMIACDVETPNKQWIRSLGSNSMPVRIGSTLYYRAHTDVPPPYEVHWQVVNTGAAARDAGGLRGDFFRGKNVLGGATKDQHYNEESTAYVGTHSIQCFVVKDGMLVTWSDPFYIRLAEKQRYGRFRH